MLINRCICCAKYTTSQWSPSILRDLVLPVAFLQRPFMQKDYNPSKCVRDFCVLHITAKVTTFSLTSCNIFSAFLCPISFVNFLESEVLSFFSAVFFLQVVGVFTLVCYFSLSISRSEGFLFPVFTGFLSCILIYHHHNSRFHSQYIEIIEIHCLECSNIFHDLPL